MTLEEKKGQLYDRMAAEQEEYKAWLCGFPPEEILEHSYSYATREDILTALEYMDLEEERVDALLKSPSPLSDIYDEYCNIEGDYMDVIRDAITESADKEIERQYQKDRWGER